MIFSARVVDFQILVLKCQEVKYLIPSHSLYVSIEVPYRWTSIDILKPSSNWLLFKLIISDQTLIKLKWFYAYICVF